MDKEVYDEDYREPAGLLGVFILLFMISSCITFWWWIISLVLV